MIFPGVIRRQIQGEGKFASHALGADHIDILAVCLDDLFRDSKAEACAFFIFSSGRVCFIEALPDFFDTVFWYTFS